MLEFLRDRIVNRPLKLDRVTVRLVAVFGSDRDAQLAQGLFDQDGAVVFRLGTEVEAIWRLEAAPEAARDAQARRIRQLWSDAGLEPAQAQMYGAPPLDQSRVWHAPTVEGNRFPSSLRVRVS